MSPQPVIPLAIISPVRDEAQYVRRTLEAMVAQTMQPQEWLFVDDGSTDDTRAIIESYTRDHPWIRVISRDNRGFRQLGSGVIAAFNFGRECLSKPDYQFIAKLDGDMSFPPRYLEVMLERLASEPQLAAVSGKVFRPEKDGLVEEFIIDEMVAGQFKLYKRAAFDDIGGFTQTILWDGIDIHRCRMKGYRTLSFDHPEARLFHHRLMGSSDSSVYTGRVRLGRGIWFMGYHPLYAIASGLFRMHEKPYVIGGLIIIASYFYAAVRREPKFADREFIRDLRQWQLRKLRILPKRGANQELRRDCCSPK
jgi:glycosyltransferase involved in cell wall biosynthesis